MIDECSWTRTSSRLVTLRFSLIGPYRVQLDASEFSIRSASSVATEDLGSSPAPSSASRRALTHESVLEERVKNRRSLTAEEIQDAKLRRLQGLAPLDYLAAQDSSSEGGAEYNEIIETAGAEQDKPVSRPQRLLQVSSAAANTTSEVSSDMIHLQRRTYSTTRHVVAYYPNPPKKNVKKKNGKESSHCLAYSVLFVTP